MSPDVLWATKYAPLFAEEKAKEDARREEAFLDLPVVVCGEELRAMTPMDLLVLNGIGSPFVCGGEEAPGDIAVFLWWMNTENDRTDSWRNERRKAKMIRRIRGVSYAAAIKEIRGVIDGVFQDAPEGSGGDERRPLGTCFLVPLVMRLAKATGWSKAEIMGTPMAQLFQFLKAIRAEEQGKDFVDRAPSDRIMGRFLAEVNGGGVEVGGRK